MAEFTGQWFESDETGRTRVDSYTGVLPDDYNALRDQAAKWSFGRVLTPEEQTKIQRSLPLLALDDIITIQYFPRIELIRATSGLTFESFGSYTRKVGRVSYYTGNLANNRALVENKIAKAAAMAGSFSPN